MKIQGKIFYCLFTIVLFLILVTTLTYEASSKVSFYRDRAAVAQTRFLAATNLRAQVRNQLLETFDALFVSGIENNEARINDGKVKVAERITELGQVLLAPGMVNIEYEVDFKEVSHFYKVLQTTLDEGVALFKKGKIKDAQLMLKHAREIHFQNGFIAEITAIIDQERLANELESKNLAESIITLKRILLLSAGTALILSILLSTYISRSIGHRLKGIEKAAEGISAGDFAVALNTDGQDEVSTLSLAMNKMAFSLREAKEQILKQQELLIVSSKMSSLGEMATGIAHEINTPLAVISLRASLLKEFSQTDDFAMTGKKIITETCDIIDKTAHRIARIITGLRAFARDGAADPYQSQDIQTIVSDTQGLCGEKFRNSGVDLQIIMPEAPLALYCRGTQISQVLLNLLSNAFDAIHELEQKWIKIEVVDLKNEIEISVTDSGKGIDPAHRSKLGQPFFTTKDVGKGTGLGLSISRGIVMDHKGRLYLDEKSAHTRFVVILPKQPVQG